MNDATQAPGAPDATGPGSNPKGPMIVSWVAQIVAAGILGMAGVTKLTGNAAELASELPGGSAAVMGIGALEVVAVLLLLIPKLAVFGALLAAGLMGGALVSHATILGFSGDLGGMWVLAVVVLLAAGVALAIRSKQILPG